MFLLCLLLDACVASFAKRGIFSRDARKADVTSPSLSPSVVLRFHAHECGVSPLLSVFCLFFFRVEHYISSPNFPPLLMYVNPSNKF